jgi:hypothetical protein
MAQLSAKQAEKLKNVVTNSKSTNTLSIANNKSTAAQAPKSNLSPVSNLTIGQTKAASGQGPLAPISSGTTSSPSMSIGGANTNTSSSTAASTNPIYTRPPGPPEGYTGRTDITSFRGDEVKQLDKMLNMFYSGNEKQVARATKDLTKFSVRMVGGPGNERSFLPGSYEDIIGYATGSKRNTKGSMDNTYYPVFGKKPAPTFSPSEETGMVGTGVTPAALPVPEAVTPDPPTFPEFNFTMPDPVMQVNSGAAIAGNATGFKRKESKAKSSGRTNKGTSQLRINPTMGSSSLGINLGT